MSNDLSFALRQFTGSNDLIGDGEFKGFVLFRPNQNAIGARPAFDSTTDDGRFVNFVACAATSAGNGDSVCGRGGRQQPRLCVEAFRIREGPL